MRARHPMLAALPAAAVILFALVACVPVDGGDPGTSPAPTAPTVSISPSASPTTQPSSPATGVPVTIGCEQLVTAQAIYDYNPNFSLQADYSPAAGSLGAQAIEQRGIACSWINQTSGETIEIAVAQLPEPELTALKNNLVMTSNSVPTYDVEGYFEVDGGVGVAQAFPGPYWLTGSSTTFFEPGDAAPLIAAAVVGLG